jgi:hypothetical protein
MKNRAQTAFDVFLFIGLLAVFVMGCIGFSPKPRNTASEFLRQYSIGLHGAFSETAAAIENGGVKTDSDLLEFLKPRTEAARVEAARTIDQYMEANMANGELSRADAKKLRELATMFKDASP